MTILELKMKMDSKKSKQPQIEQDLEYKRNLKIKNDQKLKMKS